MLKNSFGRNDSPDDEGALDEPRSSSQTVAEVRPEEPDLTETSQAKGVPRVPFLLAAGGILVLFASAFILLGPILSKPDAATVSVLAGEVSIERSGTQLSKLITTGRQTHFQAGERTVLLTGDRIVTGADSQALLTFFDGTTAEMTPHTNVTLEELQQDEASGPWVVRLKVWWGKTIHRVRRALSPASRFEVVSPSCSAAVRGTAFNFETLSDEHTRIAADQGVVHVRLGEDEVDVHAGEVVDAIVGQPLVVKLQNPPTPTNTPAPIATAGPAWWFSETATHTPTSTPTRLPTRTSTPTSMPTPVPTSTPILYVVKSGDTLGHIARDFGISVDLLAEANGLTIDDPHWIFPGQTLLIPPPEP